MNDLFYLAPLGVILVAALFYLGRIEESRALRLWLLGFGALLGGALFIIPNTPLGWAVTSLFSSAFVALMYAGAISFAERPIPRWLAPLAASIGVLRAASTLADWPGPLSVVAGLYAIVLLGVAGETLRRYAKASQAGLAERLMGPAMATLGVLLGLSIGARFLGVYGGSLFGLWISAAGVVCVLQSLAGLERTRRRETLRQQELEQERRTLRAVIETAPVDIVLRDDRGGIRMTNRSAAERFGIALGEGGEPVPGQDLPAALLGPPVALSNPDGLKNGVTNGAANGPTSFNLPTHVIPGGQTEDQSLQVFTSPVVSESGESLGRLWIGRDVTQEARLQLQLVQSQKMETIGTLAGGVAHDFNNHLTTILGNARLAGEHLRDDQLIERACLTDLERAAEHCAELTQGLLAFARRTPTTSEALAVPPVLGEVESLLRSTLPRRIELDVERPTATWWPLANATQLKQVILNLAINGRDAIQGRGTIRLAARNRMVAQARSAAAGEVRPGRYVEFTVEDTGSGIDPSCGGLIFDPFFTTKPTGEGTGLGLAIAYGVVSAHDGYIDLESEPGHTVLRFGLPAVEAVAHGIANGALAAPRGAGETVLLADDEPAVRRLLRGQLESLGYRVVDAECGEQAVEIASQSERTIDVAVLDFAMPGIDGLGTLDALRSSRPGLPGLIVSGFLDPETELRIGDDVEVLLKPFDHDAMARALRRALDAGA